MLAGAEALNARVQGYGVAATLPSAILAILWLFQHRLDWNILIPGLAWRFFLTVYALPSAVAVWRRASTA